MNTSQPNRNLVQTLERRPLYINFELYTEDDQEFKRELTTMLIKNICEFKQAFHDAVINSDPEVFFRASHKVKVALSMLDDEEFTELAGVLEEKIGKPYMFDSLFKAQVALFNNLCNSIIKSLEVEIGIS